MKTARVAINGFGRIGRASFKIALEKPEVQIVAINDLSTPRILAHFLKYDTVYGIYDKEIYIEEDGKKVLLEDSKGDSEFFSKSGKENYLVVEGKKIKVLAEKEPLKLPWKDLDIDVVLECTGRFTTQEASKAHLDAGAKKVVLSAPAKGEGVQTFLLGVNDSQYLGQNIISNASCTTNCISPVLAVIDSKFKIAKSMMTTIHAVTVNQSIVDTTADPNKPDLRRTRSGMCNIVPTSTGASDAVTQALPDLLNKFEGISIRVPVITGSLVDLTALVEKNTTVDEINKAFLEAEKNPMYKNVLKATYEPIVSSDIIGSKYSAIVDLSMTKVLDKNFIKVLAWYDNEWGYSCRLVEMAILASL